MENVGKRSQYALSASGIFGTYQYYSILKNLSCKKFTCLLNRHKSYSDLVYHWVLGTSRRSYWPYSHHFGTRSARLKWTNQPTPSTTEKLRQNTPPISSDTRHFALMGQRSALALSKFVLSAQERSSVRQATKRPQIGIGEGVADHLPTKSNALRC